MRETEVEDPEVGDATEEGSTIRARGERRPAVRVRLAQDGEGAAGLRASAHFVNIAVIAGLITVDSSTTIGVVMVDIQLERIVIPCLCPPHRSGKRSRVLQKPALSATYRRVCLERECELRESGTGVERARGTLGRDVEPEVAHVSQGGLEFPFINIPCVNLRDGGYPAPTPRLALSTFHFISTRTRTLVFIFIATAGRSIVTDKVQGIGS